MTVRAREVDILSLQYSLSSFFDADQLDESRGRITRESVTSFLIERERRFAYGRTTKQETTRGRYHAKWNKGCEVVRKKRCGMVAEEGLEPGDGIADRV